MKKYLWLLSAVVPFLSSCQGDTLTVKGKIADAGEGTVIALMAPRVDERGWFEIESQPLPADGAFVFRTNQVDLPERIALSIRNDAEEVDIFEYFFGAAGKTVVIQGSLTEPWEWRAKSGMAEQKEYDRFNLPVRRLMYDHDRLSIVWEQVGETLENATPEDREAIRLRLDSLEQATLRLRGEIDRLNLDALSENPNTQTALGILASLADRINYDLSLQPLRGDIERVFGLLTPEYRDSDQGKAIDEALHFPSVIKGRLMPEAELTAPDGQTRKLSEYRGKYLLLDFWASWCQPCIQSFPALRTFAEAHPDDVAVIGINIDETPELWRQAAEQHGVTWNNLYAGAGHPIGGQYAIESIPRLVLVSPEGVILEDLFEYRHSPEATIEEEFQKYIAAQ